MRSMSRVLGVLSLLTLSGSAVAATPTCEEDIGQQRAAILVRQCIEISPASHPPCNADNPCWMIKDEIERGCQYAKETPGVTLPEFCNEDRGDRSSS